MSLGGMVTSPHHLASAAGRDILRAGGTAVEAAVATAAALAVVYPHMTGIGGDGFWLISDGQTPPVAIHATGRAGALADPAFYAARGMAEIPWRGPEAAVTVPGTVSGWEKALAVSAGWQRGLPLAQLLEAAIHHAERGMPVTRSQSWLSAARLSELAPVPGFAEVFLTADGAAPVEGHVLRQPALAATLRRLVAKSLRDFYEGETAGALAADLARAGSPVTAADLRTHQATSPAPLSLRLPKTGATVYNTAPPTQGLASLLILGIAERLDLGEEGSFAHYHGLIEATKRAFRIRDRHIGDPDVMTVDPGTFLTDAALDRLAADIDPAHALLWPQPAQPGDTIWLGVTDAQGRTVSYIQSLYYEFGSGLVSPETGVLMQNRGSSFRLTGNWNVLAPGRRPFTTLNPAMAFFDDGRQLTYGTMGGEGQPQTQAAIFTRIARFGMPPQRAVSAPRWLLGKTWGAGSLTLKVENRTDPTTHSALVAAGHEVEVTGPYEDFMGHAGALLRSPDGVIAGATDPRSDGSVSAC